MINPCNILRFRAIFIDINITMMSISVILSVFNVFSATALRSARESPMYSYDAALLKQM